MSNFLNSPTKRRTSSLFSAASGSSHSVTTIIGIGGAAGVSSAPVIVITAGAVEDLATLGAEGARQPQHRTPGAARQRRDRRRRGRQQGKDVAARGRRRPRSGGSKRRRRHGIEPQGLCKARVDVFDILAGGELESHAVDGGVAASQQEKGSSSSGSSRRECGGRGIVKGPWC